MPWAADTLCAHDVRLPSHAPHMRSRDQAPPGGPSAWRRVVAPLAEPGEVLSLLVLLAAALLVASVARCTAAGG